MSQDVNQDWTNRDFVESIEMAMRKCVDFLSDFHEQAKFRLSEVDQRLTSLERKADFIEAQLANADPSQRNAKPKAFEGSTFDPSVRREQVKKFRERLVRTEKVFSDRIIAPRKQDGARGKLIVGGAKKSAQPQEILGAPKMAGKGNIPIAQMQKQMSKSNSKPDASAASPAAASSSAASPASKAANNQPGPPPGPPSKAAIAAAAIPMNPGPPPEQPKPKPKPQQQQPPPQPKPPQNRPPPSAAEANKAIEEQKQAPPVPKPPGPPAPGGGGPPGPPGGAPGGGGGPPPPAFGQPIAQAQPPAPGPPPPGPPGGPGSGGGETEPGAEGTSSVGEGGTPGDGGPGSGGFPHGDPNAIDMQIIKPGNGNVPGAKDKVLVEYTGFLADGTKFIEHKEKLNLGLKQNIKGLEAGLQRMQEGTFAKLWIPYKLAYGSRGAPPLIPQAADLTFEITLIKICDPNE